MSSSLGQIVFTVYYCRDNFMQHAMTSHSWLTMHRWSGSMHENGWVQVATGHALLADLNRVSKEVPQTLRHGALVDGHYAPVMFDYRYFKEKLAIEQKIEASSELQLLDDQFRDVGLHNRHSLIAAIYCSQFAPLAWREKQGRKWVFSVHMHHMWHQKSLLSLDPCNYIAPFPSLGKVFKPLCQHRYLQQLFLLQRHSIAMGWTSPSCLFKSSRME